MWLETASSGSIWRPSIPGIVFLVFMSRWLWLLWLIKPTKHEKEARKYLKKGAAR